MISLLSPRGPWLPTGCGANDIDGPFRRTPALAISPLPLPPPPPNTLLPLSNPGMKSSSARNSLRRARHPRCWWSFTTPCRPCPRHPRRRQSYRSRMPRVSYSSPDSPSTSSSVACSNGLGTDSGKDGGCIAGSLALPEAGHGVI